MRRAGFIVFLALVMEYANVVWAWIPSCKILGVQRPSTSLYETVPVRQHHTIRLASGNKAQLISRTVPIVDDWSITVWEYEKPAQVVESYWEAHRRKLSNNDPSRSLLDPFGIVSWPGSVAAARKLQDFSLAGKTVLILGAGVGLEAQAAAQLGAQQVIATDIHPTTLQQLECGISNNPAIPESVVVQTQLLDLFDMQKPLPIADLVVVADVLYSEQLAAQAVRRLVQFWQTNPNSRILLTDSQRFVDILPMLTEKFEAAGCTAPIQYTEAPMEFTGSGVAIDEDQTYQVNVRTVTIGL